MNEHGDAVELLKRLADQFAEGPSDKAWEEMSDSINWFLASLELAEYANSESTEKQNE